MEYNEQYNDSLVASNQQAQLMSNDYQHNEETKEQDLLNLYEELRKQREYMYTSNSDHSLDNLIESTNNHISILSTMLNKKSVKSYQAEPNTPQPHLRPYIPNNIYNNTDTNNINNNGSNTTPNIPHNSQPNGTGRPNTNNNVPNIDTTTEQPSNTPNDTQSNNNDTYNTDNTQPNNTSRTRSSRGSPLQSGLVSLAKSLFNRVKPRAIMDIDRGRNRFHNRVVELSNCQPHNKLITNECNILRLLLLYLTLHPYCSRNCTLSTIATDRLGILMQLI